MKKTILYSIGILSISLLISNCGTGSNSNKKAKSEKTETVVSESPEVGKVKAFELSNKNVIKWYNLKEKKVENYIEDKIVGTWVASQTLIYLNNDKEKISKLNIDVKEKITFEEGGFFKTPKFSNEVTGKDGLKTIFNFDIFSLSLFK